MEGPSNEKCRLHMMTFPCRRAQILPHSDLHRSARHSQKTICVKMIPRPDRCSSSTHLTIHPSCKELRLLLQRAEVYPWRERACASEDCRPLRTWPAFQAEPPWLPRTSYAMRCILASAYILQVRARHAISVYERRADVRLQEGVLKKSACVLQNPIQHAAPTTHHHHAREGCPAQEDFARARVTTTATLHADLARRSPLHF
mmetsp:Transcript_29589/g.47639  ORF Transcript_29589/g.47639 Transcript_29589/m.47639 type:complete len:202 (+) Transcript_29589:11-616(+)